MTQITRILVIQGVEHVERARAPRMNVTTPDRAKARFLDFEPAYMDFHEARMIREANDWELSRIISEGFIREDECGRTYCTPEGIKLAAQVKALRAKGRTVTAESNLHPVTGEPRMEPRMEPRIALRAGG